MKNLENKPTRDVYIVDGLRTPFLKARGRLGPFTAADLGVQALRSLLLRQPFKPSDCDEVIVGCVIPSENEANIARIIALRAGLPQHIPAFTVQRNCASGLQAIESAALRISQGFSDLVIAGGTEAMSHAAFLLNKSMADWLTQWMLAKSFSQRMGLLTKFRPSFLTPVHALQRGLIDPLVNLNMGQTAENLAYHFNISRDDMDAFAAQSHQRVAKGQSEGFFSEITPIYDTRGKCYVADDGVRADSSVEKLAKLPPFFDKKYGAVTAGNSSQVTDGASFLILASEEAVEKYRLKPRARIREIEWSGLDPAEMGLGPVHSIGQIFQKQEMSFQDVDYVEINEAFAAQVIGCVKAFADPKYCKDMLGLSAPLGNLSYDKLNVDGGAIALGHPFGASGARLVLHLMHTLERNHAKLGIASLCIGGGQGGAILIERKE